MIPNDLYSLRERIEIQVSWNRRDRKPIGRHRRNRP